MGADPDDADPPDEAEPFAELDVSPELREELRRFSERAMALVNEPPTEDEHGNPPPRLDVENPPATPPEDRLLRVGYALLARLPEHWPSAMLQVHAAADEVRTQTMIFGEDAEAPVRTCYFIDLAEPCLALRRASYEPDGRGAWYSAMIRLFSDGTIRPTYNYTSPPFGTWGAHEVELLIRDQELYPRDPEALPSWHPAR
jgi:hypothetical protein